MSDQIPPPEGASVKSSGGKESASGPKKHDDGGASDSLTKGVIDPMTQRLLDEAKAYRFLGLYEEAEATLRPLMATIGEAGEIAQQELMTLLNGQQRFSETAYLGYDLMERSVIRYGAIIDTALALHFLGRFKEARNTLHFVVDCGASLANDAYQMACFASRLGEFNEALEWLLFEFRRSTHYHALAYTDTDLNPFWDWLWYHHPTLDESHGILQTPFMNVHAAALENEKNIELSAADLNRLPQRQRKLLRYDYGIGMFVPYPLAVASDPKAMADFLRHRRGQRRDVMDCIDRLDDRATDMVLAAQPRYVVEHAAWGNHLGARYHILWATSVRANLIANFFKAPHLELMQLFLRELALANEANPGFGRRMQRIAECEADDRARAWELLEETPESLQHTGLFRLRLAGLYHASKEYENALPLWEELRRLWPADVAGFSKAIDGLLKLGRREDAKRLLRNAPSCYRRYGHYWRQFAEINGGEQRYHGSGFPYFRGQPDLGGQLVPEAEMRPEDRPAPSASPL